MSCRRLFTDSGAENFKPRMARIYTDGKARVCAWASQADAAFSNHFTSELARDCETTSLTRFASGPAFSRFAQNVWNMGNENTGMPLACQAGRRFGKASESSLPIEFAKMPRHSRS